MTIKLRKQVAASLVTGSLLMSFGIAAHADAAFDLINKLVDKGILTEEEAVVLMKSSEADKKESEKRVAQAITNKIPIKVSHGKKASALKQQTATFRLICYGVHKCASQHLIAVTHVN